MEKDYYKILEVPYDADENAIKKAFRKLAKQFHPDTNTGNPEAEIRFREINEAYTVLGDEEKKRTYDESRTKKRADAGKKSQKENAFAGFNEKNFKMNFGDMIFEELNNKKSTNKTGADINFGDVSSQFASFFGFKPR